MIMPLIANLDITTTTMTSANLILQMLAEPFMQRALVAAVGIAILLSSLGVFVMLRNMAFVGDGLAHSSLAGIALAIALGLAPIPVAMLWAVIMAVLISMLRQRTKISTDALIGIAFTTSMALGVIIMNALPGYRPELVTYLFGSILGVQTQDLIMLAVATAAILTWLIPSFNDLTFLSLSEEAAQARGVKVRIHETILTVALAIITVLGVKLLGVILVSALLIIPPATAKVLAKTFRSYVGLTIVTGMAAAVLGLTLSYIYDLPSGAVITATGAGLFLLANLIALL